MSANSTTPAWRGPRPEGQNSIPGGDPFKTQAQQPLCAPSTMPAAGSGKKTPVALLLRGSEPDVSRPLIVGSSPNGDPVCGVRSDSAADNPVDVGKGVVGLGGHYIKVGIVLPAGASLEDVLRLMVEDLGWGLKLRGSGCAPPTDSKQKWVIYCFDNVKDAEKAIDEAQMIEHKVTATYVSQTEFAAAAKSHGTTDGLTNFFDGQVLFVAEYDGDGKEFDNARKEVESIVRNLAKQYGEVLVFGKEHISRGTSTFRVEYCKISDAKKVLMELTEKHASNIRGWTIFSRDVTEAGEHASPQERSLTIVTSTPRKIVDAEGVRYESPTGRTGWYIGEDGKEHAIASSRRLPKARSVTFDDNVTPIRDTTFHTQTPAPRHFTYANGTSGAHVANHRSPYTPDRESKEGNAVVYVERIRAGNEVRSTIMIRGVPMDMEQDEFLNFLNLFSKGKYDFAYLRFDFSKGTNVGYAFVNFVDAVFVAEFVDMAENNPYRPAQAIQDAASGKNPKTVGVAFAAIQGLDCCIAKFRNSSIMDEVSTMRPKLFYTYESARRESDVGKERAFPPPDNFFKHRRSRDNAGSQGLYAHGPQAHRQARGRSQRSQFDRGTTAQVQQEALFNQMSPMHGRGQQVMPMQQQHYAPQMMHPQQMFGSAMGYPPAGQWGHNGMAFPVTGQYAAPAAYGFPPFAQPFNPAAGRGFQRRADNRNGSYSSTDGYAGGAVQSPNGQRYVSNPYSTASYDSNPFDGARDDNDQQQQNGGPSRRHY